MNTIVISTINHWFQPLINQLNAIERGPHPGRNMGKYGKWGMNWMNHPILEGLYTLRLILRMVHDCFNHIIHGVLMETSSNYWGFTPQVQVVDSNKAWFAWQFCIELDDFSAISFHFGAIFHCHVWSPEGELGKTLYKTWLAILKYIEIYWHHGRSSVKSVKMTMFDSKQSSQSHGPFGKTRSRGRRRGDHFHRRSAWRWWKLILAVKTHGHQKTMGTLLKHGGLRFLRSFIYRWWFEMCWNTGFRLQDQTSIWWKQFLILPKTLEKMTVDGNMSAFHSCHSEYLEWLSARSTDQPDEKLRW